FFSATRRVYVSSLYDERAASVSPRKLTYARPVKASDAVSITAQALDVSSDLHSSWVDPRGPDPFSPYDHSYNSAAKETPRPSEPCRILGPRRPDHGLGHRHGDVLGPGRQRRARGREEGRGGPGI